VTTRAQSIVLMTGYVVAVPLRGSAQATARMRLRVGDYALPDVRRMHRTTIQRDKPY
jgi:hypothetical protein